MRERAVSLVEACRKRGLHLGVAESCTGGLLGATITSVPGASEVFLGGVLAYQNEVKVKLLGVQEETLARVGAVSSDCAGEMATGTLVALGATESTLALSITGIAGPGGATPEKPVGTVWIGLAWHIGLSSGVVTHLFEFAGDRDAVRSQAVVAAFKMAQVCLEKVSQ